MYQSYIVLYIYHPCTLNLSGVVSIHKTKIEAGVYVPVGSANILVSEIHPPCKRKSLQNPSCVCGGGSYMA